MKDPFGKGMIAGIVGVIAINIVEFILKLMKISETALWEAGGIVFLSEQALKTPLGIAIGVLSHIFVAIFVGIGIAYYLHFSGMDFAVLKGIGISLIALFIALGIFFPLRGLAIEMQGSPNDVSAAFIDHIVFGALGGYIVKYLHVKSKDSKKNGNTEKYLRFTSDSTKDVKSKGHKKFKKPKKI